MSNYFQFTAARQQDRELKLAIKLNVVPDTCLLHGALVMGYHEMNEDPCSECSGPPDGGRQRCKGRPMREVTVSEKRLDIGSTEQLERTDDATYRRLERRRQIIKLNRIIDNTDQQEES